MRSLDFDWQLRLAAFDALGKLRDAGGGLVRLMDLEHGFKFEGKQIPFMNARRGIWKPGVLGSHGAALSIVTTPPRPGRTPPYDDQVGSDDGWFAYKYQGEDPGLWPNRAVRRAMEAHRPLIYLYGQAPGLYDPIFPCYVRSDDPAGLTFFLEADVGASRPVLSADEYGDTAARRAYATATVKVRLHQRRFRELVVRAYRERCAVCRLRHPELLDGAHILPDRDERGRPEVPNGLSLCKIHHGAFDAEILGIDPDYRIHIRRDILEEHDGPMLRHGLQEMDRQPIVLPSRDALRPNREYLEERFERFRAA